jgi:hypothetical protein
MANATADDHGRSDDDGSVNRLHFVNMPYARSDYIFYVTSAAARSRNLLLSRSISSGDFGGHVVLRLQFSASAEISFA